MATDLKSTQEPSVTALVTGIISDAEELFKQQFELFKHEVRDDFRKTIAEGPPEGSLGGPILADAKYPDVLVARAFSNGNDLDLVLYSGAKPGPQKIRIERLRPEAKYSVRNGAENTFAADRNGAASLSVELQGRTPIHVLPAS